MNFLCYDGRGNPESDTFQNAIIALYSLAFTLKMSFKFNRLPKPKGFFEYRVPPLEGLWWKDGNYNLTNLDDAYWKLMIMIPPFIGKSQVREALTIARRKNPDYATDKITFYTFNEGKYIQTLHQGKYSEESSSVGLLTTYLKEHHLKINGKHHEIYLSDPRKVSPELMKTAIRYPISSC